MVASCNLLLSSPLLFSSLLFSSHLLSSSLLFSSLLLQSDNEVGEERFIPQSPPPSLQKPFSSLSRAWAALKGGSVKGSDGEAFVEALGAYVGAKRKRPGSEAEATRKQTLPNLAGSEILM